ncbi:MAG TPA: orotidine-5'-phosphate decarboxylase [Clostridiales bacterium]|nr:orotidine-5'-phosphate decarboxylase [Clostridiales bacterium]
MAKDVIIALDFPGEVQALAFLEKFGPLRPYVKVGMELYFASPRLVSILKNRGHRVFLDMKLHDIPNTVKGAMAQISQMGVDMVNLHAAGGREMMEAALEGLTRPEGSRPLLIAVTQLTSTGPEMLEKELLISKPMEETVLHYAKNAAAAGLDGVVCSALEAQRIKEACGAHFVTVTPGIRFNGPSGDDQKRVATPGFARENGGDYIVVGRPITRIDDPKAAYERCLQEFLGGSL